MESKKVILSADSTCDLSMELKERYQVHYYPFHIVLEGRDYMDNVDITTDEIYKRYYEKKVLPKTAAINVTEYIEYFRPWVEAGYEVVHLNLGGALSSAHQNCMIAASELGNVYPVDSCNLSTGIGLLVIEAGEMIKAGRSASEIAAELKRLTKFSHASFILDTLTFMHAGGRCSGVVALGANLLNLKPCIEVNNADGSMGIGNKYRGNLGKVLVRYTKDQLSKYQNIKRDHIFITHSGISDEYIRLVKETIMETMDFGEIHVTRASCTIASHCGPNTLGVLFETEAY
jgi:DegV family protein with EDD domain